MQILFVHKNFPAQFGHIAHALSETHGYDCSFVSELPSATVGRIRRIQYRTQGGATKATHYCSRTFENYTWHSHAVYEALKEHPDIVPDLIVGHSGFGSTVFLADLYDCPIINYCEYYYHGSGSDMDFRPDFPSRELDVLRARTRNAMLLLDLETCTAAYSPTQWQRSLFPETYRDRIETLFDGVDTSVWYPRDVDPRKELRVGESVIPADRPIVTYVSRGFEAMRGFDVFMHVAKRICDARDDVIFVCVGSDRVCYGGDLSRIEEQSYRAHVLAQDNYDLDRFVFTGMLKPHELAAVMSRSDLHLYLTVPFVLSWSLMNALACGCTVLASDTAPVREMIQHNQNGLLAGFFDEDALTAQALEVLDDPDAWRWLGEAGREMIEADYSLDVMLPRLHKFYVRIAEASAAP